VSAIQRAVRLASIHVYPLKGARGISLDASDVLRAGLRHDRRFMLVDADGAFMTQREHPELALVDIALGADTITIGGEIEVPLALPSSLPRDKVTVWKDTVDAVAVPGDASQWLGDRLGVACTLYWMPSDVDRPGFTDAYPVLVATLASLADLNARLDTPVPMDRFRPNLVVEGGEAFEEERHPAITIGAVRMTLPKRCDRCVVTTVDQRTAKVGKEPLRTLASYRKDGNRVYFAMNAIPEREGRVAVNDPVTYT
jgi:uncharacterized protein YcbX